MLKSCGAILHQVPVRKRTFFHTLVASRSPIAASADLTDRTLLLLLVCGSPRPNKRSASGWQRTCMNSSSVIYGLETILVQMEDGTNPARAGGWTAEDGLSSCPLKAFCPYLSIDAYGVGRIARQMAYSNARVCKLSLLTVIPPGSLHGCAHDRTWATRVVSPKA